MGLNDGSHRSHLLAGPVPILPIDDKSATEDVLVRVPCGADSPNLPTYLPALRVTTEPIAGNNRPPWNHSALGPPPRFYLCPKTLKLRAHEPAGNSPEVSLDHALPRQPPARAPSDHMCVSTVRGWMRLKNLNNRVILYMNYDG